MSSFAELACTQAKTHLAKPLLRQAPRRRLETHCSVANNTASDDVVLAWQFFSGVDMQSLWNGE